MRVGAIGTTHCLYACCDRNSHDLFNARTSCSDPGSGSTIPNSKLDWSPRETESKSTSHQIWGKGSHLESVDPIAQITFPHRHARRVFVLYCACSNGYRSYFAPQRLFLIPKLRHVTIHNRPCGTPLRSTSRQDRRGGITLGTEHHDDDYP